MRLQRPDRHHTGVVDQDVDSTEPLERLSERSANLAALGHITLDRQHVNAARGEIMLRAFQFGGVTREKDNRTTTPRQFTRHRQAQTARRAGDQRSLAMEISVRSEPPSRGDRDGDRRRGHKPATTSHREVRCNAHATTDKGSPA